MSKPLLQINELKIWLLSEWNGSQKTHAAASESFTLLKLALTLMGPINVSCRHDTGMHSSFLRHQISHPIHFRTYHLNKSQTTIKS